MCRCRRDQLARARHRLQKTSDVRVASGLLKSRDGDAISKSLNAYGSRINPVKKTVGRMPISGSAHMLMWRRHGCKRILENSCSQKGVKCERAFEKTPGNSGPRGDNLSIGQSGVDLHPVNRGAGRAQPEPVLGAAEIVDQFLPATAIHLRPRLHRRTSKLSFTMGSSRSKNPLGENVGH